MAELIKMTLKNLGRKRLRTALTVAGIGVGTLLITVVSFLGDAGKELMGTELKSMGLDGLSVSANIVGTLTEDTLHTIRDVQHITAAMPLSICFTKANSGTFDGEVMACGIDAGADQVISLTPLYGRMLSRGDVGGAGAVCVVDEALAQSAYGRKNIVGKTLFLHIGSQSEAFTVVGVSKAGSSVLQNIVGFMPEMVYFPFTTLQNLTGVTSFDQIAVRFDDAVSSAEIKKTMAKTLYRQNENGAKFAIEDLASQREKLSGLMDIVTVVLQIISSISLLVAGMSIMTIMLMSVHERTGEIGIKKAIGATPARIMTEFLAEAVLLTFCGSVAGITLAAVCTLIGGWLFGILLSLSPLTVGGVLLFSMILGVVFGVYPAKAAADLQPVEALHSVALQ